jgi:hypothetical protein
MLSLLSLLVVLVGLFFLVSFSLWLWFMIYRPSEWARFIEEKRDIWAKRGESVGWAGAVKNNQEGRGLKIAVVICIVMAAILTIAPFIFLRLFLLHG